MKRNILFLFAFALILMSCSENPEVSSAYNKYRLKDGVVTVSVPGWVVHLAAKFGDLDKPERELLESIDRVKVIAVDDPDLNREIDLHQEFYARISENGNYEELMAVRDDDENVTIFGVMEDDVIKEMLILVGGNDDNALVYIKGHISPDILNDQIDIGNPDKFLSLKF